MFPKQSFRILAPLMLIGVLILSSCAPLIQPGTITEASSTPVITVEAGQVDNPNIFVDPESFQAALLQALAAHDTEKLQMWMTEPFLTGTWRIGLSESSPAEALKSLYTDQLGAENSLSLVKDADLNALMGGKDPLSIPPQEAGVTDAFLVSGWGKDGRDEAILFVARQADDNLKWRGWMQVRGGFSGTRLGGIQFYQNDASGYSLYVPKDYEVSANATNEVMVLAPGVGHPSENRGAAFIFVEPANGRTAEQVVEAVKAELGPGFNVSVAAPLDIEGAQALVVSGLPGQDSNRQLFMVHNDLLFHMMFVPDNPQVEGYRQMEDAYAMIVNTFHFTK